MIEFTRSLKMISVGPNPGPKYVAQIKYGQTLEFEVLGAMIAEQSAMTLGDVHNVLIQATTIMQWALLDGRPVSFGDLGKFYPKFKAKAMEEYKEVNADTISNLSVRFLPGMKLRNAMKNAKIRFVEPITPTYAPKP